MDGWRRKLSRPAFGRTEFNYKVYSAFDHDQSDYDQSAYSPTNTPVPQSVDRGIPFRILEEAKRRGFQTFLQIHPLMPPGLQEHHMPSYPDGSKPGAPQIAFYGNPAEPTIRTYGLGLVRDTLKHAGRVDGLFIDWTEYGAYRFEDLFVGVDAATEQYAREQGYSWDKIEGDVVRLWDRFHQLHASDCEFDGFSRLFEAYPGWKELQRLKAEIIASYYREVRHAMDRVTSGVSVQLMARGWPPPWNRMSGLWYEKLVDVCDVATPKLFAFDYCAIPRWYGEQLLAWNSGLDERDILSGIASWLGMSFRAGFETFERFRIPATDEEHPLEPDWYRERVRMVLATVGDKMLVRPFAHAHMPDAMWKEMVRMLSDEVPDGMWVQMYGYLSDSKLAILREHWDQA